MARDLLRSLFTGFVRLHVLYHADKQPVCGVEIMEELRQHGYRVGPGTIYPLLHDLELAGHLRCTTQIIEGKRRKNFRITSKGQRLLAQAREKLKELSAEIIEDRDAMALRRKREKR
jgi:DNA-binding PadR family transcriptional regulator